MKFIKNDFLKSVSVLLTGTLLAQLISISVTPLISRFYGPEENAYLGLFLKITSLIATISTARLEIVIPMEKNKNYAFGIYQFSFFLSVVISITCLCSLVFYSLINYQNLESTLFLLSIPIGILLISFFNLGNSWELRTQKYKSISRMSIVLSISSNALKIIGGIFSGHFLVLIGATIFSYFLASLSFLRNFIKENKTKLLSVKSKRTKVLLKQNQDYYTYNLFHVLIDLSRDMLIASFIWMYFSKLDYGSYEFAYRILKLPIVFLGMAISQVFFRKASELINKSEELKKMTYSSIFITTILGFLPFVIVFFYGQEIFSFVFGEKWIEAGRIAEFVAPVFFINFIFTPISFIPILLNKQKMYFWINFISLFVLLIIGVISHYFNFNFEKFTIILSVYQGLLLIVLILWFIYELRNLKRI